MKTLLMESLYFSRTYAGSIFRIIGPFFIVMALFGGYTYMIEDEPGWLSVAYLTVFIGGQSFYICRLIKFMGSVVSGSEVDLSVSVSEWFRLLIVHILYGIAVLVGILALIIPGIYMSAKYGFAEFECVLNKRSPMEALGASWEQTKGHVKTLMLGVFTITITGILFDLLLDWIGEMAPDLMLPLGVLSELGSSIVVVLVSVFYFRVYVSTLEKGDTQ